MPYKTVKFRFSGPFRFGRNSLSGGDYCFAADTLFSALYIEALKKGKHEFLLQSVQNGRLLFSDAFPWLENTFFLPKPLSAGETELHARSNSILKKKLKKLKYISIDDFDSYLNGTFDPARHSDPSGSFVRQYMKVSAAIRGNEEAMPYRIRMCEFSACGNKTGSDENLPKSPVDHANKNAAGAGGSGSGTRDQTLADSGLYIIVKYHDDQTGELLQDLLSSLSYSGLGGKRFSGCGRFEFEIEDVPASLSKRLNTGKNVMSISIALPDDSELEQALDNGTYAVVKRSGFIASDRFASQQMKKRDLYMLKSGSCFRRIFQGSVRNVACRGGSHPVYRYGKPIFVGIDS